MLLSAKVSWLWDCAPISSLTLEQVSPSLFPSPSNARFYLSFRSQLSPLSFNWNITPPGTVFLIYVRKFYFQIVFPLFWNSLYLPPPVYCLFSLLDSNLYKGEDHVKFCSSCFCCCCYCCFKNAFNICPIVALKKCSVTISGTECCYWVKTRRIFSFSLKIHLKSLDICYQINKGK